MRPTTKPHGEKPCGERLRCVMRQVPFPVAVVTTSGAREVRGITVGSLQSVSLAPPLISFNVSCGGQMHAALERARGFAVNFVGEAQVELCKRFAVPGRQGREQFASLRYQEDENGNPWLEDAWAVLRCRIHSTLRAGDHLIVIGEVLEIQHRGDQTAPVYVQQSYRGVGEQVDVLAV